MAGRTLNRRELRKQADRAEPSETVGADPRPTWPRRATRQGQGAGDAAREETARKKLPPRLRARWGVFDSGMKQVAVFDYNQRAAAEEKLANLAARKKGAHFLQIVKEPMPEPAPVVAPSVQ